MLFNSLDFFIFLPIIFALYWLMQKQKISYQNGLLLVASYFFYACWDWRFLFLLIFSTSLDYIAGLMMQRSKSEVNRKFWFWLTISVNLGFLGVFKYYNFFIESFESLIQKYGFESHFWTLNIILPVGISFYTFHGLSYVIDIYKKRIEPEHNIIEYALFVSYFPLLVAGPIERATHLLPQIKQKRKFDYQKSIQGLKQIIWGLFKKVVIADNCAFFVNQIFDNSGQYSAAELWLGSFLFAFQIYGDFSGYSDIALGTSKLFGIDLLRNFNYPYFSKDIADFWRRWHISLSTWFRDYLYIPLGGSRGTRWQGIRNTFIIFLVSGFWHGANLTFIIWGLIHALLFMPLLLSNSNRNSLKNENYSYKDFPKIFLTFLFVCLAWVFFRADNLNEALEYIFQMFNLTNFEILLFYKNAKYSLITLICLVSILWLVITEWKNVKNNNFEIHLSKLNVLFLILMIFFMGAFKNQMSFIYFQF